MLGVLCAADRDTGKENWHRHRHDRRQDEREPCAGGTSLSSPLWEGIWARIQAASGLAAGNGFATYALYRVGKNPATYPRDFFDVTSTDPATGLPSTDGFYPTLPGWD